MNAGKSAALRFRKKYRCGVLTDETLTDILESQGYTVIEFNSVLNDPDVSGIITSLGLSDYAAGSRGFTYADDKYRLVFVHDALTPSERLLVLAHEEGHIFCGHIFQRTIIGYDVEQEYEANEFVHELTSPGPIQRFKQWVYSSRRNSAIAVSAAVVLLAVLALASCFLLRQTPERVIPVRTQTAEFGEFYITESGTHYHRRDCMYIKNRTNVRVMTQEEFDSGYYEPCGACLPQDSREGNSYE